MGYHGDDNREQSDVRAYAREGTDLLALLLIERERGHHRPVGDVVEAVCEVPEQVTNYEYEYVPERGHVQIRKQHDHEESACHRADQHPRFVFAEARLRVVHDHAHERIVERVEDTQAEEDPAHQREHTLRKIDHVGQVE